jgi:hypothetical protein
VHGFTSRELGRDDATAGADKCYPYLPACRGVCSGVSRTRGCGPLRTLAAGAWEVGRSAVVILVRLESFVGVKVAGFEVR